MEVSLRHFLVPILFIAATPQAVATTLHDLVDCTEAVGRFEMVLCSNLGAYDLLNHIHQIIVFGPQGPDLEAIRTEWAVWIENVELECMQHVDTRFASECLYEAGISSEAEIFIARVHALYPDGSDIEGSNECDGCDLALESKPLTVANNDAAEVEQKAAVTEAQLTEIYLGYLLVSLCAEFGLQFDAQDVTAMEAASKQAEATLSQLQREMAWSSASAQADNARMVFQLSYTQGVEMCDGTRLFVGGAINEFKQAKPKPF